MKTYLQFRRALRAYYANEPAYAGRILARGKSRFWYYQWVAWTHGDRSANIHDATCACMLS